MALVGNNDMEKMSDLGRRPYKEQGVWFLNCYMKALGGNAVGEAVWTWCNKFAELDKRGKDGNELDEFGAHRFLESLGETLSVKAMRDALRDIDLDFNKKVALIEYIVYKYKSQIDIHGLVNASLGDKTEINKAMALLEEAQKALELAQQRAEESKKAEAAARSSEAEAKSAENDAKAAEADQKRALAELHKEEEAYNGKIAELTNISTDASVGIVKKNKAAAELAQLKAEDPLPLRRAKINQGASVRKSEAAARIAVDARIRAEGALKAAVAAREEAESSLKAAEAAFDAAEKYVDEVRRRPAPSTEGALWWIARDLEEGRKYLPQRAGGVAKK